MTSLPTASDPEADPPVDPNVDLPSLVVEATAKLLMELVEQATSDPDFDHWHVSAAELDIDTPSSIRTAWMITVVDARSRLMLGSTVVFEPLFAEAAEA